MVDREIKILQLEKENEELKREIAFYEGYIQGIETMINFFDDEPKEIIEVEAIRRNDISVADRFKNVFKKGRKENECK